VTAAGIHLLVRARGAGPYELVLRCTGAGQQRFAEPTFEELERAIAGFAPFLARRRADIPEVVRVDADALDLVRHSESLDVEVIAEQPMTPERAAAMKAARFAEIRSAHAAVDYGTLLRGYEVQVRRPASLAWWRAVPVAEWPPLRVTLADNGAAIVTDGHHRCAVARELGVEALTARVRTVDGVLERTVGCVLVCSVSVRPTTASAGATPAHLTACQ
jgi:hypothetical protein